MQAITQPTVSSSMLNGVAPLTHLGVIQIEGEDAAKFIHGQLTQDFSLLDQHHARLAGFCNAKGRMQASFVGFKRPNGTILLVCSLDVLPATLKRLSMFVMRAKAKLSDATDSFSLYGLAGNAIKKIAEGLDSAWAKADFDTESIVNLYPADGVARQLCVALKGSPAPLGTALDLSLWQWSEIRSGVATLTQPVFEAFVPQMLNYESIGGVNFKKGCYPGQEVVARSQFRGTLKKRTFLAHCDAVLVAGDEIFYISDPDQPVGTVVQSAVAPDGGYDALIALQLAAVNTGGLALKAIDGPPILLQPLPYSLLEDI
jgi:tRNA-modifying protein YgfZ